MFERMLPHIVPGLIYGMGSLGIALTFRYLRFPDFTVLGSIMVGGVVCVSVSNATNPIIGLIAGFVVGGVLGTITGLLVHRLQMQRVLAGIVTFTGSYSVGYIVASQGTISLEGESILSPKFEFGDVITVLLFTVLICSFIGFLIKTKFGSLLMAMTADKQFLRLRHRDQGKVILITLMIGNSIVGLAGALYSLKDHAAYVITHMDFLPFSLGAIFGGNAVIVWLARRISEHKGEESSDNSSHSGLKGLLRSLSSVISADRDDTSKVGILFFIYVIGCLLLKQISGLVNSNAFTTISPILNVPTNIQYLVVAILIAFFVWWARWEEED